MTTVPSNNPSAQPALTPKVTADNGGNFADLLQPKNQSDAIAAPTDLTTAITAINAIRTALIAAGLVRPA